MKSRLGAKKSTWVVVTFFFAIVVLLWGFLRIKEAPRLTIAFGSDPIILWSTDETSGQSMLFSIPGDTLIDAVGGFGTYEGRSLWKLNILSESLEETFGVAVPWYIGPSEGEIDGSLQAVKNVFSLSGIVKYLRGVYRTNISPIHFIRILLKAYRMNSGNTKTIDLRGSPALIRLSLPDGSTAQKIDVAGLDSLIGHEFEDERVRRETMAIGVYNTTGTPTLGSRFARKLSHLGALVLLVDNSKAEVLSLCEIRGSAQSLKSYTAQRIRSDLGCVKGVNEMTGDGADLEVFIGSAH